VSGKGVAAAGAVFFVCLSVVTAAEAQQADPSADVIETPAAPTDRAIYDQAFFASYNVNNAEDMLRVIPGVPAILNDTTANIQERGFGSGGARVLINGRRFPGKANEINTNLRRITAANVARVELISGAASGISVQSEGLLVNVVLREGASIAAAGSWEINGRFREGGQPEADGLLSYTGSAGGLSYSAGIERNAWTPASLGGGPRWSRRFREEVYYYPNGAVQEVRPQDWERHHKKWIYTTNLTYDFKGGQRAQLNGFYQQINIVETDQTNFTRFDTAGAQTLVASDIHDREYAWYQTLEVGGEFESPLWGGNLDALFIARRQDQPQNERRNQEIGARVIEISRSETRVDNSEDIGRAVFTAPVFEGQTIELGGEAARNVLNQNLRVFFDRNGDDRVEQVFIPTASAEVVEVRGEVFATHKWAVTDRLSLESRASYEKSRLTNNYPFSPERNLGFLKPRLDLRYKAGEGVQYRLLVDRTISQLEFANFVPKFDFVDNEIDAGNPGLRPEKTWVYEIGYERRLPHDAGLVEARLYYNSITDAIEKVPLTDSNGFYSALGNLPDAVKYGAEVKASLRLGFIGLSDALLSLRYQTQKSETHDPFTGEARRLTGERGDNFDISFRHDLRALGASYGFTYKDYGGMSVTSDLVVRSYFEVKPPLEVFVEKEIVGSTVLRIEAQNIGPAIERQDRVIFATTAMNGVVRRYEHWTERRGMRVAVRLRGSF
jgi:outer membrane receptor protein involved in Fe transport